MSKRIKKIIITLSAAVLIVFIGCSAIQDAITPCYIAPAAIDYADVNSTSFMPYTSLWDAYRVEARLGYIHRQNQINFARLAEDDAMRYGFLKDAHTLNIQGGQEFQRNVFSAEGPIGLAIPTICSGTMCALLVKRPGDVKKKKKPASIDVD